MKIGELARELGISPLIGGTPGALDAITEPILMPLRRIIPLVGMVDITPMVAVFLLYFIAQALASA